MTTVERHGRSALLGDRPEAADGMTTSVPSGEQVGGGVAGADPPGGGASGRSEPRRLLRLVRAATGLAAQVSRRRSATAVPTREDGIALARTEAARAARERDGYRALALRIPLR